MSHSPSVAAVLTAASLLAVAMAATFELDSLEQNGLDFIRQLHADYKSPALTLVMTLCTRLGFEVLIVAIVLATWGSRRTMRHGVDFFELLLLANYLNAITKSYFHRPRPLYLDESLSLGTGLYGKETSFFSGHSLAAVLGGGYLYRQRRDMPSLLLAIGVSLAAMASRVYLAVHFPHDVVVGAIVGLALLLLQPALRQPTNAHLLDGLPSREPSLWQLLRHMLTSVLLMAALLLLPLTFLDLPNVQSHSGLHVGAGGLAALYLCRPALALMQDPVSGASWAIFWDEIPNESSWKTRGLAAMLALGSTGVLGIIRFFLPKPRFASGACHFFVFTIWVCMLVPLAGKIFFHPEEAAQAVHGKEPTRVDKRE